MCTILNLIWLTATVALPPQPKPIPPPIEHESGVLVEVEWQVTHRTPGCFFFSGPGTLGRDTQLGTSACLGLGTRATATFGRALFVGTTGNQARLTRTSRHTFRGQWVATEVLSGTLGPLGRFAGQYRYSECKTGESCPGQCRLAAQVKWVPIGACRGGSKPPRNG